MALPLAVLTKRIGYVKSSITRVNDLAKNLGETVQTEPLLRNRLEKLEETYKEFMELSKKLYEYSTTENFVDPSIDMVAYEEKYFIAHAALTTALKSFEAKNKTNDDSINKLALQQAEFLEKFQNSSVNAEVHYEKIKIPTFSGNYEDWQSFHDLFSDAIDGKENLTNTQKFHYLKSYLSGDALNLIKHIPITGDNYPQAWERLKLRYNKKPLIIRSFVQNFLSLPQTSTSNVTVLRKIHDGADEVLRGLDALDCKNRDPFLIYILLKKLDDETKQAWAEQSEGESDTIDSFLVFLSSRCDALETLQPSRVSQNRRAVAVSHANTEQKKTCKICNATHAIFLCEKFKALDIEARRNVSKANNLCYNCLSDTHKANQCKSTFRCRTCKGKHHSLLHMDKVHSVGNNSTAIHNLECNSQSSLTEGGLIPAALNNFSTYATSNTLLPTIVANVVDTYGRLLKCRILLDSGSTKSFVTESFVQRAGLSRQHARVSVFGFSANNAGVTRGRVHITLQSQTCKRSYQLDALIMEKLTSSLPAELIDTSNTTWTQINRLKLADPSYNVPGPVDIIIGSDQLWNIYTGERLQFGNKAPIALNSIFGWVIAGSCHGIGETATISHTCTAQLDTDIMIRTFMEMESVQLNTRAIDATEPAENHFCSTHKRDDLGTYVLQYPFKDNAMPIDSTLKQAIQRFYSLERKFRKDPSVKQQYVDFMDEYIRLGHMELIPHNKIDIDKSKCFYLAHHAVFKNDSTSTKCRVVFDGSCKDDSGYSLNERLHIGPSIQRDLFGVTIRFRQHRYVFTTDIEKMFRGIKIDPIHTNFQRIVWRKDEHSQLQHYRLTTVTYGLSPSPFLAVRVLQQLANDYKDTHKKAALVLANDTYVDDIATGCGTIEELVELKDEIIDLLSKANFNLRKWCSNCWPLLESLSDDVREQLPVDIDTHTPDVAVQKILGLKWNPSADELFLKINNLDLNRKPTKRIILSELSTVFDPLGIVAPTIILLKVVFQETWCHTLGWDDELPEDLCARWHTYMNDLPQLTKIRIPRNIASMHQPIELHVFADASASACAAVVYSRIATDDGYIVRLIASRTRVAPLKPISIPRLELNAAVLATRLLNLVKSALTIPISGIHCWTDSEIVLHWLSAPPRKWTTFVCNRTAEILDTCARNVWHHVRSQDNPADCASRGLTASILIEHELWWTGPRWLLQSQDFWPKTKLDGVSPSNVAVLSETKRATIHIATQESNVFVALIDKLSSWTRLIRTVAYCLRFINNCRKRDNSVQQALKLVSYELQLARCLLIRTVQKVEFASEYKLLMDDHELNTKSKIIKLLPYMDDSGLLRVGGRIHHSFVNVNAKHPIILPKTSPISLLIIRYIHEKYLHTGVEATFVATRQQYWILGARNIIRKVVHRCKKCFMLRQTTSVPIMANLPSPRIQPHRPFLHCGLDYAGPFLIKETKGRNPKHSKAYFAIFVCLSTKAIHIELVSDLTTNTFIAALLRFTSIRGKPTDMYSDNGTTFHGSKRILNELQQLALQQAANEHIANAISAEGITWHFIPPSSPHFGGIWESGVKSVKLHLRRVIGCNVLTFEEYQTLLTQISAVLNSRPMCAAGDDQLDPLTPAHFLIGEAYSAVPEPSLLDTNPNRLLRWKQIQAKVQGFWKRWHMEYLTSLQQRSKWQTDLPNLTTGTLVVLKEPNLPPSKWIIGRIEEVFPGDDHRVRVVSVKTTQGTFKRPVAKVAI